MKKLIVGILGIMVFVALGCSTTQTVPPAQTPEPAVNKTARIFFERGNAYTQIGNFEDAVKDFTEAINSDPQFADAYYSRGRVLGRLGKHEQAIDDFTKAISLNPENANAYADRGAAYGFLGQHALAISDFSQAIHLNPDLANAYYNRAIAYFSEKKCMEARKDVRKAQDLGYPRIQQAFLDALNKDCPES